jgi:uncharacterized protein YegP (UPF0339 family)
MTWILHMNNDFYMYTLRAINKQIILQVSESLIQKQDLVIAVESRRTHRIEIQTANSVTSTRATTEH